MIGCSGGKFERCGANDDRQQCAGKKEAEACAGEGEHGALREQKAQRGKARGAEGGADGEFPPARDHASREQAREVQAGEQKHDECGGGEREQARPDLADQDLRQGPEAFDTLRSARAAPMAEAGKLPIDLRRECGELGGSLRDRVAGLQPRKALEVVPVIARIGGAEFERLPEVGGIHRGERRRHHADYGEQVAVQAERSAYDLWVGVEGTLPERVAEDDGGRGARGIVRPAEGATEQRADPEGGQIAG